MPNNSCYLVVLTSDKPSFLALDRAILIATNTQASLKVLCVSKKPVANLDQMESTLRSSGLDYQIEQAWDHGVFHTIEKDLELDQYGLIVKETVEKQGVLSSLMPPADWRLLREAHCPVLLVKPSNATAESPVLAALHVGESAEDHFDLNRLVLESAYAASRLRKGGLSIVAAYPAPMQADVEGNQDEELLFVNYQKDCVDICKATGIEDATIIVDEGPVESLLSKVAKQKQAGLVVVGTEARSGLLGALVGNIAEQVLAAVPSDILVLRRV